MKEIDMRRSVRAYTGEPLLRGDVEKLLRAAMCAPTARNQRPWEFIVLEERDCLEKVQSFHPFAAALSSAPCAIVVCADSRRLTAHPDTWVCDCSAAVENLLLEAVHLGLGTVWMAVHPYPDRLAGLRGLLGLPEYILPLCLVAVGHPACRQPERTDPFQPERIHWGGWTEER